MKKILQSLSILIDGAKLNNDQLQELKLEVNQYVYEHQDAELNCIAQSLIEDIEIAQSDIKYHEDSANEIEKQINIERGFGC